MDEDKFKSELKFMKMIINGVKRGDRKKTKNFLSVLYIFKKDVIDLPFEKRQEFMKEGSQLKMCIETYLEGLKLVKRSRYPIPPDLKRIEQDLNKFYKEICHV